MIKIRAVFAVMMFLVASSLLTGCATINKGLKSLVGRSEPPVAEKKSSKVSKFSEDPTVAYQGKNKNYQRMTREKFENDAQVNGAPGSLWVMEGQSSYMFSSNVMRLQGEVVNVKMDGAPKNQLETKVKIIKQMIARLEKPKRKPASAAPKSTDTVVPQQPPPEAPANENANANKENDDDSKLLVETVPARIVDRTVEGNYRIKGSQNFMIGKKEYKVIVTGLVRPNDVNGDEVKADQILDPKFDIVSLKKELKL